MVGKRLPPHTPPAKGFASGLAPLLVALWPGRPSFASSPLAGQAIIRARQPQRRSVPGASCLHRPPRMAALAARRAPPTHPRCSPPSIPKGSALLSSDQTAASPYRRPYSRTSSPPRLAGKRESSLPKTRARRAPRPPQHGPPAPAALDKATEPRADTRHADSARTTNHATMPAGRAHLPAEPRCESRTGQEACRRR